MTNTNIVAWANRLFGYHTRLKELHFSAPTLSLHKVLDDFDSELLEFTDTVLEDAQAVFGVIMPGELEPVNPKATEAEDLLIEIRSDLAEVLDQMGTKTVWTGITDCIQGFWHTINKTVYLIRMTTNGNQG